MSAVLRLPRPISAQDVQAAIVGIAYLWQQAIGPLNRGEKINHPAQAIAALVGQRLTAIVGEPPGAEAQLGHQPLIRNRRFVIRAVREHLHVHFLEQPRATLTIP